MQSSTLPDPGTLFDSVMVRKKFEPHPNEISSMLFYLGSIIIHGKRPSAVYDSNYAVIFVTLVGKRDEQSSLLSLSSSTSILTGY